MKQSLPQRKPIRLTAYDYAQNGAYFITICTENRACLFGEIADNLMVLNDAGKMVESVWHEMPLYYANILLDAFVIMPNHIHFIVFIERTNQNNVVGDAPCGVTPINATRIPQSQKGVQSRNGMPRWRPLQDANAHAPNE